MGLSENLIKEIVPICSLEMTTSSLPEKLLLHQKNQRSDQVKAIFIN